MICLALLGVVTENLVNTFVGTARKFSEKSSLVVTHQLTKRISLNEPKRDKNKFLKSLQMTVTRKHTISLNNNFKKKHIHIKFKNIPDV